MRQKINISTLNRDLLRTLNLIQKDRFTFAAALFADQNPVESAQMVLIAYRPDFQGFSDQKRLVNQSILQQFDTAMAFFDKHRIVFEQISGVYRQTKVEIPLLAFREALANAIIHRDYQNPAPIKIDFYPDRVEVVSPGTLPDGVSKEEYLAGRLSIPKNRVLADLFFRLGLIEKLATGILRIKESYQDRAKQPEFMIFANSITVILPREVSGPAKSPETKLGPVIPAALTQQEIEILNFFQFRETLNRQEISDHLGLGKTRVHQILTQMISEHLIYPVGSGRNRIYRRLRS